MPPINVTQKAESLREVGRIGCEKGEAKVQLKKEPLIVAPIERRIVGTVTSLIDSCVDWRGEEERFLARALIMSRIE